MFEKQNDPTPEEIRQRSAEIRAEWDVWKHRVRAGQDPEFIGRWAVPQCDPVVDPSQAKSGDD